jgi:hypothetical protein
MKTNQRIIKCIALSALFLLFIPVIRSQEDPVIHQPRENKEKLKAHKIAFITDRLQLTPAEAEKFWPVYNEHEAFMQSLQKDFRKAHPFEPEDIETMKDSEANALIEDHIRHEQQMLDQRKAFLAKLQGVIPPKKILMLMEAEKDFRVEVVKRVSGKDGPPPPHGLEKTDPPVKK